MNLNATEPAYEVLDLQKPGLFQRLDLRPGYHYNLEAYDLPGAIGITHDPVHWDASHLYCRLVQGLGRIFNPRRRGIDHHLVHGFVVVKPIGDNPSDELWLVGHSTWEGGVTSKRHINHLSKWDEGTRVWYCTHEGVRFWNKRVLDLMCFQRGKDLPEERVRPKFSTCAGATLFCHSPQVKEHSDHTLRRIACAVADVLAGRQIHTTSGGHVRRFTCLALVTFAMQTAIAINLLTLQERERLIAINDREERVDALMDLCRQETHSLAKFLSEDSLGQQNSRVAWPAVFAKALDEHSEFVDVTSMETELEEEYKPSFCC